MYISVVPRLTLPITKLWPDWEQIVQLDRKLLSNGLRHRARPYETLCTILNKKKRKERQEKKRLAGPVHLLARSKVALDDCPHNEGNDAWRARSLTNGYTIVLERFRVLRKPKLFFNQFVTDEAGGISERNVLQIYQHCDWCAGIF